MRCGPRVAVAMAGVVSAALFVACAGSPAGGDGSEEPPQDVVLRFAWWGSDTRHELTQQAIDIFEEDNPGIRVDGEFSDFGSYWERLATTMAAGNPPDVMQFDEMYLREYADRGVLADLSTMAIDTSDFQDVVLATGNNGAGLTGLSVGVTGPVMVASPSAFESAGVEMPADDWSWDDYIRISAAVSEATESGIWGSETLGFEVSGLNVWARQHGESLYGEDGLGLSEETIASFWEMILRAQEEGATPPPSHAVEEAARSMEQSGLAAGSLALGEWWSHNLAVLDEASGEELVLLRMPGVAAVEGSDYLKSAMYWSISARSEHPDEAALFVDFLANDERVAELFLADRGIPSNLRTREAVADLLGPSDRRVLEYIDRLADEVGDPSPTAPAGAGASQTVLQRYTSEVLFETMTPREAAAAFHQEISSNLE